MKVHTEADAGAGHGKNTMQRNKQRLKQVMTKKIETHQIETRDEEFYAK